MKRIFTLAAAAVTVFAASAVNHTVERFSGALCSEKLAVEMSAPAADFMSRADEPAIDLPGSYVVGMYQVLTNQAQVVAEFFQRGAFDIQADPEVENGYLVTHFLEEFWNNNAADPNPFNALKATWDAEEQSLTILPRQTLYVFTDTDGKKYDVNIFVFRREGNNGVLDPDLGLKIVNDHGRFVLDSSLVGFLFGFEDPAATAPDNLMVFNSQFGRMNIFRPNGSMTGDVHESNATTHSTWPVYALWMNGRFYVYGFSLLDYITASSFEFDMHSMKMVFDSDAREGSPYTAHYLQVFPEQGANIDEYVYACEIDPKSFEPLGDSYYLAGNVTEATGAKVNVEFPAYAMFNDQDARLLGFTNTTLTFEPDAIAGIENVEAAESADAPVVYYNLQGMRVMNPSNGIFIRQQGRNASKVLVK